MNATIKQLIWMEVILAITYGINLLNNYIDETIVTLITMAIVSAFCILYYLFVLLANLYERITRAPSFVLISVAAVLIIPSSWGVRGMLYSILLGEKAAGVGQAFGLVFIVAELVVGNYIGNAIVPPVLS